MSSTWFLNENDRWQIFDHLLAKRHNVFCFFYFFKESVHESLSYGRECPTALDYKHLIRSSLNFKVDFAPNFTETPSRQSCDIVLTRMGQTDRQMDNQKHCAYGHGCHWHRSVASWWERSIDVQFVKRASQPLIKLPNSKIKNKDKNLDSVVLLPKTYRSLNHKNKNKTEKAPS